VIDLFTWVCKICGHSEYAPVENNHYVCKSCMEQEKERQSESGEYLDKDGD